MNALAKHYHTRQACKNDIGIIIELWQKIDKEGEPRPFGGDTSDKPTHARNIIEHIVTSDKAELLVCTYQGNVIATISGHIFDKPAVELTPVGVIYSLWVDKAHRKQGVARYLLNSLENTLKNWGAQAIQVGWDSPNNRASQWWQRQGYQPYEVIASKVVTPCQKKL